MSTQTTEGTEPKTKRSNAFQKCKFCREWVNLDDEGNQYGDGSAAHEGCADAVESNRANAADFRD